MTSDDLGWPRMASLIKSFWPQVRTPMPRVRHRHAVALGPDPRELAARDGEQGSRVLIWVALESPSPTPRACKRSPRRPLPTGKSRGLASSARPAAAAAPRCIPHSPIEPSPIEGGRVEERRDFPRAHARLCGRMLPRRGGVPSDQSGRLDPWQQHSRWPRRSARR
jgi:hypothetical protein